MTVCADRKIGTVEVRSYRVFEVAYSDILASIGPEMVRAFCDRPVHEDLVVAVNKLLAAHGRCASDVLCAKYDIHKQSYEFILKDRAP